MSLIKQANDADSATILPVGFRDDRLLKGANYKIAVMKSQELSQQLKSDIWSIFEANMKARYKRSAFGWNPREKKKEMFHADSRFILAHQDATLVGFVMFRFDTEETMEDGIMQEIVYCYEVQISPSARRSGLGKSMMLDLESIAQKWGFNKIMLTTFKDNAEAIGFYTRLGYTVDEISPSQARAKERQEEGEDDEWVDESSNEEEAEDEVDYEIYSKRLSLEPEKC